MDSPRSSIEAEASGSTEPVSSRRTVFELTSEIVPTSGIDVSASNEEDFSAWEGWVQSRLRHLVLRTENIVAIRAWPAKFKTLSQSGEPCRCFFYMGLRKHQIPRAGQVNLSKPVTEWRGMVGNYEQRREGMDIAVRHIRQAELPDHCYPEGRRPVQPEPVAGDAAGTKRAAEDHLTSPEEKRPRSQDVPAVAEHPAAMDSTAEQTAPSFSGRAGCNGTSDPQDASGPSSAAQGQASQHASGLAGQHGQPQPASPMSLEMQHRLTHRPATSRLAPSQHAKPSQGRPDGTEAPRWAAAEPRPAASASSLKVHLRKSKGDCFRRASLKTW
ncbi:hypothetical protein WJX84_008683 [Apatococcus fuscideae]|uniref:Poly(A) polymerase RNA-binding domain-containing protein n=1 Tax=Apatococcus fuscideae TaxID=2026836 RepID=A0AAW1TAA8_9CHLO